MRRLTVAALMSGEPGPLELWTLRTMASVSRELRVVQAVQDPALTPLRLARKLIERHGLMGGLSRSIGEAVAARLDAEDRELLEELFDFDDLRDWRDRSGIIPVRVRALDHAESREALSAISPDVIVQVSGGRLEPGILSLARLAALNIHHGHAPHAPGPWSIPWGIVEGRRDWIAAAVHVDDGVDSGPVLWRGGPQLAPGDTHVDLLFRAHLEAAKALARILDSYASGDVPPPCAPAGGEAAPRRAEAPGLRVRLRLLRLDRGRRARVLIERGIEC
jgi:hypothetical protein